MNNLIFLMIDDFDLFRPDQPDSISQNQDDDDSSDRLGGLKYDVQAIFAPGSAGYDHYFTYCSAQPFIYLRSFTEQTIKKVVQLNFAPTCFHLTDYTKALDALSQNVRGANLQALIAVGNNQGQVIVYKVDNNYKADEKENKKEIAKTKFGLSYGAITAV